MLIRLIGSSALLTFFAFYPYLPGAYDALALPLSLVAQVLGLAGLLVVPIGAAWLTHRALARRGAAVGPSATSRERRYLVASMIGSAIVAAMAAGAAWASGGLAFGCGVMVVAAYGLSRLWPSVTASARADELDAGAIPVYLTVVPLVACVLQVALAQPMTTFSRDRAIANGAALIADIERYHVRHGTFPPSLSGAWPDYKVSVVGISQFHYSPRDDAYNLYFEQPVPIVSAPGTREFVVYNPRGRHIMLSHAAWNLTRSPEALSDRQGWYSAADASHAGWKRFRFD